VGDASESDAPSTFAFVLTEKPAPLLPDTLRQAWASAWPAWSPLPEIAVDPSGGDDPSLAFELDGMLSAVSVMPDRVPGDEDWSGAKWLWPNAAEDLARYRSFVVVWVKQQADRGRVVDAYWQLTRLVVSVIRATGALGVYMSPADGYSHLVRADVFDGMATDDPECEGLPVMLWLGLPAYQDNGRTSVITVGLERFGTPEVELVESARPVGELREFAMDLAGYLIQHGPVLADGHTVGGTERDQAVVAITSSIVGRPEPVYQIEGY
jgi:hypothetical protein